MVTSSISEAERRAWNLVLGVGFVATVAGSAGLIAYSGGATLVETAVVTSFGLLTGVGLVLFLSRLTFERSGGPDGERDLRRR